MIQNVKLFGERNSGTNFLASLIHANGRGIVQLPVEPHEGSGWKHGFPDLALHPDQAHTLFVFVVRDLRSWLQSMFKTQYHYACKGTIVDFITEPLHVCEVDPTFPVHVDPREQQNVVALRYAKLEAYMEFIGCVDNAMVVSLSAVQRDPARFFRALHDVFRLNVEPVTVPVLAHTKTGKLNQVNRVHHTPLLPDVVPGRSETWELFVEGLDAKPLVKRTEAKEGRGKTKKVNQQVQRLHCDPRRNRAMWQYPKRARLPSQTWDTYDAVRTCPTCVFVRAMPNEVAEFRCRCVR
jgi:hypothetical protein